MKKMKKIYWMLFIILCAACNDPYDGDTYVVFDMQPAGTYLSNRSDDFSEWIHIMKCRLVQCCKSGNTVFYTFCT